MGKVVLGLSSTSGSLHILDRQRLTGKFVLISPKVPSSKRKLKANYTLVDDLADAIKLIENGYHARMRNLDNEDPPDILRNEQLRIVEAPD